ncbi:unnamed protein product, partial [Amoebophrya sp. A25]
GRKHDVLEAVAESLDWTSGNTFADAALFDDDIQGTTSEKLTRLRHSAGKLLREEMETTAYKAVLTKGGGGGKNGGTVTLVTSALSSSSGGSGKSSSSGKGTKLVKEEQVSSRPGKRKNLFQQILR